MKCSACNRSLTRASYSVGRLNFGPTCFKKLLAEGRTAKKVDLSHLPVSDLLTGCYFDQQGAADRAAMTAGAAAA